MWEKHKVVLLPSNEKSKIVLSYNNVLSVNHTYDLYKFDDATYQHLYILSNEEIKEGDWFINREYFIEKDGKFEYGVWQCDKNFINSNDCYKIIASTDSSLIYKKQDRLQDFLYKNKIIPSIPQSFIDKYISEYNKGNMIEEVMVEYENIINQETQLGNYDNLPLIKEVIKINPDNTINIKSTKDTFTLDEMYSNMQYYMEYCQFNGYVTPMDWIEKHKHF